VLLNSFRACTAARVGLQTACRLCRHLWFHDRTNHTLWLQTNQDLATKGVLHKAEIIDELEATIPR